MKTITRYYVTALDKSTGIKTFCPKVFRKTSSIGEYIRELKTPGKNIFYSIEEATLTTKNGELTYLNEFRTGFIYTEDGYLNTSKMTRTSPRNLAYTRLLDPEHGFSIYFPEINYLYSSATRINGVDYFRVRIKNDRLAIGYSPTIRNFECLRADGSQGNPFYKIDPVAIISKVSIPEYTKKDFIKITQMNDTSPIQDMVIPTCVIDVANAFADAGIFAQRGISNFTKAERSIMLKALEDSL